MVSRRSKVSVALPYEANISQRFAEDRRVKKRKAGCRMCLSRALVPFQHRVNGGFTARSSSDRHICAGAMETIEVDDVEVSWRV
jgi:hypothetical protein